MGVKNMPKFNCTGPGSLRGRRASSNIVGTAAFHEPGGRLFVDVDSGALFILT